MTGWQRFDKSDLEAVVSALQGQWDVLAPVQRDGEIRFRELPSDGDIMIGPRKPLLPLKSLYLPEVEDLFSFTVKGGETHITPAEPIGASFDTISDMEPSVQGLVFVVDGPDIGDDLDFVAHHLGKERADRAVGETGGEDRVFAGAAFSPEERAGDATCGVKPLFIVDGEREKVDPLARVFGHGCRGPAGELGADRDLPPFGRGCLQAIPSHHESPDRCAAP